MRRIYRTYSDTEVTQLSVNITCPYCEGEWAEPDLDECGKTHTIECENCENEFEMHFDAS